MAAVFRFALSQTSPLSLPSKTITWSCKSPENRRVWPNDKHNQVFASYLIAFTLTPENFLSVLCGKRAFRPRDLVSSPRLAENRVTHSTLFFPPLIGSITICLLCNTLVPKYSLHIRGIYTLHANSFCVLVPGAAWKTPRNSVGSKLGSGTVPCVTSSPASLCFC